ncbi:hypothetical protein [Fluviispira multicolorata]|uniref:hypothetical protein n=1 Tax=Fluviispira multicolorata TaxID=2654512 RepID=UPI0013760EA1|nr:hypothetical protein [Fluviispira multicolorata]
MSNRLNFNMVNSVLDVSCGVGHWGWIFMPFFPESTLLSRINMGKISILKENSFLLLK